MSALRFGVHLQKERNRRKMSLNMLAARSGISASQISRLETNNRNTPKPATIKKLAEGLGVSYENMLEAAGYIEPKEHRELEKSMEALIDWHNREVMRLEKELRELKEIIKEDKPT